MKQHQTLRSHRARIFPCVSITTLGLIFTCLSCPSANAQWEVQTAPTTADLRGIKDVGNGIAWASGTEGTVLRTIDDGKNWQRCTTPPEADHLDFRGIQAFDANTAVVMSSGKGQLSRLYKTTDACQTWHLIFTNPDPEGFWDDIYRTPENEIYVLGDPVDGQFALFLSKDSGQSWFAAGETGREPHSNESAFAASNSSLTGYGTYLLFGTGGSHPAHVYTTGAKCYPPPAHPETAAIFNCTVMWSSVEVPLSAGTPASGIFSLSARPTKSRDGMSTAVVIAVGGAYDQINKSSQTAATSLDGGKLWSTATMPPHGYRSAVAYDAAAKAWITVGPNGTDISTDDGRNWSALRPDPSLPEPADRISEDRNWNALSLPFVVGPHGRIGKLRPLRLGPR